MWANWRRVGVLLVLLVGCSKSPQPSVPDRAAPPVAPAETSAATAKPEMDATPGWDTKSCGPMPHLLPAGDGVEYGVKACENNLRKSTSLLAGDDDAAAEDDDAEMELEIRFVRKSAQGIATGSFWFDRNDWSAVVGEDQKLLDGHVMVLDLPSERGGTLLLANWAGNAFVITSYGYMTNDEDRASVTWKNGAVLVSTVPEGARRLVANADGLFAQETLRCEIKKSSIGASHHLDLPIDAQGNITEFHYFTTMPAANDVVNSCSVDLTPDNPETIWQQESKTVQHIAFEGGGGEDPDEPEEFIQVERKGGRYWIDFSVNASRFCGQSVALPGILTLTPGKPTCGLPQEED